MTIEENIARYRACLSQIFANYPVALAYLYGSEAVGQATLLSDFDIALVMLNESYDPKSRLILELKLEDAIARICGIGNIDLRIINEAPLMVRGEVVTNGILLYCRDEIFRVDYETSTRSEYFDFLPIAIRHREAFYNRLRKQVEDG